MAKQSNHLPPVWLEYTFIATNRDFSSEIVVTRIVHEKDTAREMSKIYRELGQQGFDVLLHSSRRVSKNKTSNFNKVSILPSSRESVFVYYEYNEISGLKKTPKQYLKLTELGVLNQSIISNIDYIKRHSNWEFIRYVIKENFSQERLKKIMELHFGS